MRVLIAHTSYRHPGGEDFVARQEAELLVRNGHDVREYWRYNTEMRGVRNVFKSSLQAAWAWDSIKQLDSMFLDSPPDMVHFHNTWPLISPGAYWAARKRNIPTVQTLHNYRLLCPNALLFRGGRVCEDCLGRAVPWPGVIHRCYRQSMAASGGVAVMLTTHRALRTWTRKVDLYIALTEFARQKFIEGGLPPERIVVKPNFVHPDPGRREGNGAHALFVGRLSHEKGVLTLAEAWRRLPGIPLKIAGAGPLADEMARRVNGMPSVELLGWQSRDQVLALMKAARIVVLTSVWYEAFPLVIADAYACGVPAVASRLGAMAEIVRDGETGVHFNPGDPEDLAAKVEWAWTHPQETRSMGDNARVEFEARYTAERNYQLLMEAYEKAIEHARARA